MTHITIKREVLERAVTDIICGNTEYAINALRTALEAPAAREPVAWATPEELEFLKGGDRASATMFNFTEPDQKFIPLFVGASV